jgi:3-isopropylmalate/(R)-2-methylmalate dehydratase large subunit
MTVACGDSHTSTHGAFGAIAFGIGTSQVRDVLASQSLSMGKLKVRRIWVEGQLQPGVYAKDLVLHIIRVLGVKGGVGYAYEFAGPAIDALAMEERMTLCNMAIEGGARCGYVNPDAVTFAYLQGRPYAPKAEAWERAVAWWRGLASGVDAVFDDEVRFDAAAIAPTVTWGITPGQGIGVDEAVPTLEQTEPDERPLAQEAYRYMDLQPGTAIAGTAVDVCFIGSCTNGRLSDLQAAAAVAKGRHVAPGIKAFVVPGSEQVAAAAVAEGLDRVFREAGFEWREPGCSMCLAMNPDRLEGRQISASSSNRNFKGRQGSASGRTLLMSPAMVAAAAIAGKVCDVRQMINTTP